MKARARQYLTGCLAVSLLAWGPVALAQDSRSIQETQYAPGGAYDYMVRGKMIGGFAVIAYPARYGASGLMSFMVNHDGVVYEKDLGKNTAALAAKITAFDPDASWKRP